MLPLTWLVVVAAVTPVSVVGEGAVEEDARRDARRQALERGAGVAVQSFSVIRNFTLISDVVVAESKGILVDEKWGAVEKGKGVVRVPLRAGVATGDLGEAACKVLRAKGEPVIAVLAAGGGRRDDIVENEITAQLMGGCMRTMFISGSTVDVDGKDQLRSQETLAQAKGIGADYVVLIATKQKGTSALTARIVDVGDNSIVSTDWGTSPAGLADALFRQLAQRWTGERVDGKHVRIKLRDVAYGDAKKMAASIAALLHVPAPEQVEMRAGSATFELKVTSDGRAIAAQLEGQKIAGNTLSVTESTLSTLTIEAAQSL